MNRVALILTLAFTLLAAPPAGGAQHAGRIPKIGVLGSEPAPHYDGFAQGLRDLGYLEGQNITIEWRWYGREGERLPDLAAELIRLKVDLIVAGVTPATRAAKEATRTIPIVMVAVADPIGAGFV